MSASDEQRRLRRGGVLFFGRITASISHEFNNVITIIGEVAGLLQDLSLLADRGRPIAPERLRRQCELIAKQLGRAQAIIKEMNRFAHSVDQERERFDLDAELRTTASLSERLAAIKGFRFQISTSEASGSLEGSRFLFHELLFVLFCAFLEASDQGGVIEIALEDRPGAKELTLSSELEGASPVDQERLSYASLLAEELGGELTSSAADAGQLRFSVLFRRPS